MIPVKPHTYQTRFWHLFRDVVKNESNECPQVTFPWTTRCPKARYKAKLHWGSLLEMKAECQQGI